MPCHYLLFVTNNPRFVELLPVIGLLNKLETFNDWMTGGTFTSYPFNLS
jgi:hypothetical protein